MITWLFFYIGICLNDKKCLSVGNFGILSVAVLFLAPTAYSSLRTDLKYLLEIPYFVHNYPNVTRFLIFDTLCLGWTKTLPYV